MVYSRSLLVIYFMYVCICQTYLPIYPSSPVPDVCVTICLFIYVDGHFGYFYLASIVDNAALNMSIHEPVCIPDVNSFDCLPKSRIPAKLNLDLASVLLLQLALDLFFL